MTAISKASLARLVLVLLFIGPSCRDASAQDAYPSKLIRLIVPFGAGGITDVVGRLVAQRLSEELKQSVVVENKPGAGGARAASTVAQSAPDGYTLLLGTVGTQIVNRMIYSKLPYDPGAFVPVSLVSNSPYVIAVAGLPEIRDLRALADYARTNPDKLNFGSAGYGSSPQLCIELFKLMTRARIVHVPFKSGAEAVNAALSSHIQVVCDAIPVIIPQVQDGRLRAITIADRARTPALPELKTSAEQGMSDLQIGSWNAILAPAGTSTARTEYLAAALARVLARRDVIDRLAELGIEPLPGGESAYQSLIEDETRKWLPVVKAANIRID